MFSKNKLLEYMSVLELIRPNEQRHYYGKSPSLILPSLIFAPLQSSYYEIFINAILSRADHTKLLYSRWN